MRARRFGPIRFAAAGALPIGVRGLFDGAPPPAAPAPAAAASTFDALPATVKYPKPPAIAHPQGVAIQPIRLWKAPTFGTQVVGGKIHLTVPTTSGDSSVDNALTELVAIGDLNDLSLTHELGDQAASLLATSTKLYSDCEDAWKQAETGLAAGAATGLSIGIGVSVLAAELSSIGFGAALVGVINALITAIATFIIHALAEVGITVVLTTTSAGGSFGAVGAAIGAIIGAIIALGNIFYGGPHLQVTDGGMYSSTDYVKTNLQAASDWLTNNPDKLIGLTPLRFSQQTHLFLANPTWLWLNQHSIGISPQPTPPDQGTGAPLDAIYTLCPGAFELLNRAQFVHAIALVNTTPQHLDFYQSIPRPLADGDATYPSQDPGDYYWLDCTRRVMWGLGYQTGAITHMPSNVHGKMGPPIPNNPGILESWLYTACPHLCTNNNTYEGSWPDGQGKISGQTDMPRGTYALQDLFPALTKMQCDMIFDRCSKAYGPVANLLPPPPPDLSSLIASIHGNPALGGAVTGPHVRMVNGVPTLVTASGAPIGAAPPAPEPPELLHLPRLAPPILHRGGIVAHPTSAPPLTTAQRRTVRAKYVQRFVGSAAAAALLRGAQ